MTKDGLRVRPGLVFRSAVPRDPAERRQVLSSAGIRGVCDLRGGQGDPFPGPLAAPGDHVVGLPYVPWSLVGRDRAQIEENLARVYVEMAAQVVVPGSALQRAVRHVILDPERPMVVWCTGGRDRTGMVIALVLHLLGVVDDEIADDYSRSATALVARAHGERVRADSTPRARSGAAERRARLRDSARRLGPSDLAPLQRSAPRGPIFAFLDAVRRQGDVPVLVGGLGIEAADFAYARAALLASPSPISQPCERTGNHAH